MSQRVEFTIPDELFERLESARGDVPRARFIKRALEAALEPSVRYPASVVHAMKAAEGVSTSQHYVDGALAAAERAREELQSAAMARQRKMNKAKGL